MAKELSKYEQECIEDCINDISGKGLRESLIRLVWLIKLNEINKWADKVALLHTKLKKFTKDIN